MHKRGFIIAPVARRPGSHTPFGLKLQQSLMERQEHVRGRGKTELTRALQTIPLGVQIQRQTTRMTA